jgi:O-antigen/teichoic acid export membrane protein
VLQGLERFGWDSFVVLADRGLLLGLGVAVLAAGGGLRGLAIAFVAARAIALATVGWMTHRHLGGLGLRYDAAIWRELQTTALPLGFFLVVLNLYSYVDAVMLGVMRTDVETGWYTAAYKLYEGMTYAPSVIAAVLTPRLSDLWISDRAKHRRLSLAGSLGSAALAIVGGSIVYVIARPLIVWLFGADFAPATAPFRILAVGLPFVFTIWVLHAIAISVDREKLLLRTGLIGLAVNVGLNLYVIPHYGANGAATATIVGEAVSLAVLVAGLAR